MKLIDTLFLLGDTPAENRQWRLLVSFFVLMFSFHVAWACGWLSPIGVGPGFVQPPQLISIQKGLDDAAANALDVKLKLMRKAIIDTRIQECKAQEKRYFTRRLEEQLDEYSDVTKKTFTVPECEDLK